MPLLYGQGAVASGNTAIYDFGLTSVSSSVTGNNFSGQIKLSSGSNFSTKLGSDGTTIDYTVVNNQTDLAAIALSGNYVLGSNISLSGTWTPIGSSATKFSGMFDGLGHSISGLSVSGSVTDGGLFGYTDTTSISRNVGISGGTASGSSSSGGLVGVNKGKVYNAYSAATVNGNNGVSGGLVGINTATGTIYNAYATGSVSSDGSSTGGLVGSNAGTIYNTFATGSVTNNGGFVDGGGLVGTNTGSIANSYATGNVSGDYNNNGGLVGTNDSGATISKSYSTGTTSGTGATNGGFVGNNAGTISDSFWDTTTSGTSTGVGSGTTTGTTGKTTADMKTVSTYSGASWDIVGTETLYPTLTFGAGTNSGHVWNAKTPTNLNIPGTPASSGSSGSSGGTTTTPAPTVTPTPTPTTTPTTSGTSTTTNKTYKKMLVLNSDGTTSESTMSPEQAHILLEKYNNMQMAATKHSENVLEFLTSYADFLDTAASFGLSRGGIVSKDANTVLFVTDIAYRSISANNSVDRQRVFEQIGGMPAELNEVYKTQ